MTPSEITDALTPLFAVLSKKTLTSEQWDQYALALAEIHPADLDDAMADLRRTYAFRNAPLPAEIFDRAMVAKRHRLDHNSAEPTPQIADPTEGEWRTFTLPGVGSVRMHVLPDDHPALTRFACGQCQDTGWLHTETPSRATTMPIWRGVVGESNECREDVPMQTLTTTAVSRCLCWQGNPVLQRRREQNARYVREKTER